MQFSINFKKYSNHQSVQIELDSPNGLWGHTTTAFSFYRGRKNRSRVKYRTPVWQNNSHLVNSKRTSADLINPYYSSISIILGLTWPFNSGTPESPLRFNFTLDPSSNCLGFSFPISTFPCCSTASDLTSILQLNLGL